MPFRPDPDNPDTMMDAFGIPFLIGLACLAALAAIIAALRWMGV